MRIQGYFCNGLPIFEVEKDLDRGIPECPEASAAKIFHPFALHASRKAIGWDAVNNGKSSAAPAEALRATEEKGAQ